ncbi:MAG TPA: sigma-70 family RNA polymerase sigma factor [Bryobacteraceae bacterium]|nr:sigma-70 family RNA polymerase sigma factor [Bryobacteraceae bacterium]
MLASCVNKVGVMPQNGDPAGNSGNVDWSELVDRVRQGDESGMEELYALFRGGIRFYFYRRMGAQDLEDKIHDTFLIVVQAIRRGELRDPERLMGFVRTVTRRQVASYIEDVVQTRRDEVSLEPSSPLPDSTSSPEDAAIKAERAEIMEGTLRNLTARDREILTRFYIKEQDQNQICREMELTETQFRLLKSRAKGRFGELGKRRMASKGSSNFLVRTFSAFRH